MLLMLNRKLSCTAVLHPTLASYSYIYFSLFSRYNKKKKTIVPRTEVETFCFNLSGFAVRRYQRLKIN